MALCKVSVFQIRRILELRILSSFISVSQATFYTFLTVLCGTVIWFLKQGNFNDLLNAFTVTKDGNHSVHWIFVSLYFVCCWMTNGQWIAYSASILQLLHMLLFCFLDMWSSQIWGCSGIYITCAPVSVTYHPRNSYTLECKSSLGLWCCMFTNMLAYKRLLAVVCGCTRCYSVPNYIKHGLLQHVSEQHAMHRFIESFLLPD